MVDKIDDLETQIDNLEKQKNLLQCIENYTNNRFDFGDLIETYNLIVEEIEKLRKRLREEKQKCLPDTSGERGFAGEGDNSSSSKFQIEDLENFVLLIRKKGKQAK